MVPWFIESLFIKLPVQFLTLITKLTLILMTMINKSHNCLVQYFTNEINISARLLEFKNNNSYLLVVLPCIILMCLDVQSNPGPDNLRHVLRNISFVNLNVNSLRNKTDLIFNELGDHDIICIPETRLNNSICSSDLCLDNF